MDQTERRVTVPDGEELRILQLTDLQIIDASQRRRPDRITEQAVIDWDPANVEKNCYSHVRNLITQTDPHLLIVTGDLVYGEFDDSGRIFRDFVRFMDSLGIPWAPVWGNHDLESAVGCREMCRILEESDHCLFGTETDDPADGTGNYAVRIERNGDVIEMVYLLDSHGCKHAYEEAVRAVPKSITENQCRLIEGIAESVRAETGKTVPSIAAWHIPTADFFEAFEALGYPNEIGTVIGGTVPGRPGDFGAIFEKASLPATAPERFAERLAACGINGVFAGHHHNINTSVTWKGIRWTMGLKCGTYDYYLNGALGGTLITFAGGIPVVRHIPVLFGY